MKHPSRFSPTGLRIALTPIIDYWFDAISGEREREFALRPSVARAHIK